MNEIKTSDLLQKWADIVIERWIAKIATLKIVDTSELLRSLSSQVHMDANGDASKIVFTFLYYGIFPDIGVGRGVSYNEVSQSNRQAKPWFSKQFYKEVLKLGHIMADRYGEKAMEAISIIENKDFSYGTK